MLEVVNAKTMAEEVTWNILAYLLNKVVKFDQNGRFMRTSQVSSSPVGKKTKCNCVDMVEKDQTPVAMENMLPKKTTRSNGWHTPESHALFGFNDSM